ncbi:MAG TPA: tyrosine-type recombinase/integrase [Solirubrobacteraceae bacterium]
MRGSTRRRGTTWTAYWDLLADPESGGRRQASKGGFRTQKDAQRHLASVITAVGDGTYIEPSRQPLARFMLDEWLPGISATVRPLTASTYRSIVGRYVRGRDIGAVPLRNLSAGHFNALYAALETEGLSVATRRTTHAVLRRALNDAVRWGKLARNPAAAADPPSLPRSHAQSWSPRELRTFLNHVGEDRLFALWRLGATTGMRRGELLGLPWRCVDLEAGCLRVEQQLVPTKGGCTFGPPKSRRSERTIALDPETVGALRRHRDVQRLERDLAGPGYDDRDLVFADELGRPIYPSRLGERFVKARKAAGLPTGTLHTLRHTAATIALTERVPLHIVAARLGDDPKTILDTYAHLLPHSDAEAAAVVAAAIVDKPLTASDDLAVENAR